MSESLSPEAFLKAVKYDDKGLVPAIAQSGAASGGLAHSTPQQVRKFAPPRLRRFLDKTWQIA